MEELKEKAVGNLLCNDTFDVTAFDDLYNYLCGKSEAIKSEYVISKQIISTIYSAQRAIENTVGFNQLAAENRGLIAKFSNLLELMSLGESPNDRKPGVPRV
jgi:hypothetical protein